MKNTGKNTGAAALQKSLPHLQEHVTLRDYTTMKVGGVADYFIEVKTLEELITAVVAAHSGRTPYFILGNGSNIIISDSGFPGIVIRNRTSSIAFTDHSQVIVDSGVLLVQLILAAAQRNLSGLEWLFATPGTIGGAAYGNAGTHGHSIGGLVRSLTLLYPEGKIVRVGPKWMRFGYRTSRLKELSPDAPRPIILSVRLQLGHSKQEDIQARLLQIKKWRIERQPTGEFSAGSFFRNPGAGHNFSSSEPSHQSSWAVIRESGAHKIKVGDAAVSGRHANFLINRGRATARDIRALAQRIKERVKEKTGIQLQEEVEYVGHWE